MPEGLLAHHLEGEGEVVLLLNGGMMSLAAWQAMAKRLAASYRVLRCDFRGQLLSPGDGYVELSDHVQDLLDLLDDRAISRAHLIGVSFGAVVGLLLAASAPERVSSIVAVTATDVVTEGSLRGIERLRDVIAEVLNGGDRSLFHDAIVADIYSAGYVEANRRDFAGSTIRVGGVARRLVSESRHTPRMRRKDRSAPSSECHLGARDGGDRGRRSVDARGAFTIVGGGSGSRDRDAGGEWPCLAHRAPGVANPEVSCVPTQVSAKEAGRASEVMR